MENVVANVVIDKCDETLQREDWEGIPVSSTDSLIKNSLTGACLSIRNDHTTAGAQVNTFTCDSNNQFERWFGVDPGVPGFIWIANRGIENAGNRLVMHPSGCGATNDLGVFMNVPGQCRADLWHFPFPPS